MIDGLFLVVRGFLAISFLSCGAFIACNMHLYKNPFLQKMLRALSFPTIKFWSSEMLTVRNENSDRERPSKHRFRLNFTPRTLKWPIYLDQFYSFSCCESANCFLCQIQSHHEIAQHLSFPLVHSSASETFMVLLKNSGQWIVFWVTTGNLGLVPFRFFPKTVLF